MKQKSSYYFTMFFFGCIVGWFWEVVLIYIQYGAFANRGVLHGPWLPIYGAGSIVFLLIYKSVKENKLLFFSKSIVACGLLEYMTSVALEYLFEAKWWDYSDKFLNLQGRVYPVGLLAFGILGLLLCCYIEPLIKKHIEKLPSTVVSAVLMLFAILFFVDVLFSLTTPNMGMGITTMIQ